MQMQALERSRCEAEAQAAAAQHRAQLADMRAAHAEEQLRMAQGQVGPRRRDQAGCVQAGHPAAQLAYSTRGLYHTQANERHEELAARAADQAAAAGEERQRAAAAVAEAAGLQDHLRQAREAHAAELQAQREKDEAALQAHARDEAGRAAALAAQLTAATAQAAAATSDAAAVRGELAAALADAGSLREAAAALAVQLAQVETRAHLCEQERCAAQAAAQELRAAKAELAGRLEAAEGLVGAAQEAAAHGWHVAREAQAAWERLAAERETLLAAAQATDGALEGEGLPAEDAGFEAAAVSAARQVTAEAGPAGLSALQAKCETLTRQRDATLAQLELAVTALSASDAQLRQLLAERAAQVTPVLRVAQGMSSTACIAAGMLVAGVVWPATLALALRSPAWPTPRRRRTQP
jgi:hypothetical protein